MRHIPIRGTEQSCRGLSITDRLANPACGKRPGRHRTPGGQEAAVHKRWARRGLVPPLAIGQVRCSVALHFLTALTSITLITSVALDSLANPGFGQNSQIPSLPLLTLADLRRTALVDGVQYVVNTMSQAFGGRDLELTRFIFLPRCQIVITHLLVAEHGEVVQTEQRSW